MTVKKLYIGPSGTGKSTQAHGDAKSDPDGVYIDLDSLERFVAGTTYGKRNVYVTMTTEAEIVVTKVAE